MSFTEKSPASNTSSQVRADKQQNDTESTSGAQLGQLLEQKDREINALKFELEKYKQALDQSQLGYRYFQQQQQQQQQQQLHEHISVTSAKDNVESLLDSDDRFDQKSDLTDILKASSTQAFLADIHDSSIEEQRFSLVTGESEDASDIAQVDSSVSKASSSHSTRQLLARQSIASACSNISASSSKVVFKTGTGDDEADDIVAGSNMEPDLQEARDESESNLSDDLQDLIQDVGDIDLELEFDGNQQECSSNKKKKKTNCGQGDKPEDDNGDGRVESDAGADGNMISDGLLTSLTDAAISNLSQLAALQERCESQQHSQYQQHSKSTPDTKRAPQQEEPLSGQKAPIPSSRAISSPSSIGSIGPMSGRVSQLSMNAGVGDIQDTVGFTIPDRFSSSSEATAAAVAAMASKLQNQASVIGKSDASAASISANSSQHQVTHSSGRSLASVVAAAAVAAVAAANDHQQQHQQHHHRPAHQVQSTAQSRLISSALSSPEFYHNLQQQQHAHAQQTNLHQMSPVSSLHFSPSTSITPSPSSLIGQSRRSASNTSSLLSPIASPSYLRRQFLPDRLPMLSSSPTSMTSGSGNSSSLAHILQQHSQHLNQQRSASAMAGTISASSGTPISGTGSSAMSPLMSSKNSSQARLNNMQIRHKFGYLGSGRAQFNSPHGFCLGLDQEIVVADTNNHRVCIFDKSGTYLTQFGSPGKDEGQLWNPRKVAILHRPLNGSTNASQQQQQRSNQVAGASTSHFASEPLYVVCDRGAERSRMQLFTKDGAFIKKIGIHYIDIVAGLAITQDGLIIVVDSVSPTVYIINGETGSLNGWFDCSGHMKEPSDIAVKSDSQKNEYFICDFKGHCVVVFSEQGDYLRKIGQDGLTSYPNGIDISDDGDILVGDSHGNRFHVVVFDRNGNFVSQFECPHVKVSRCCGLKITREGYIVTLAKNNHHVLVLDTIHI